MADRIRVFISSKNRSRFLEPSDPTLTEIRQHIKERLESEQLLGEDLFEVWINEEEPAADGRESATEHCLRQVREADVVLVLYTGDAGWPSTQGALGICHAEFKEALNFAPASVRIIRLPETADMDEAANAAFAAEVTRRNRFSSAASTPEETVDRASEAVRAAVNDLVAAGSGALRGADYSSGAPLEWSRLDLAHRAEAMRRALHDQLASRGGEAKGSERLAFDLAGMSVLVVCHAIPAALTVAAARETVGQPFLRDYLEPLVVEEGAAGPVHLIACHQGVSEAQALRQLGFPDAMIVTTPFGVYVADDVQRIQMVFLKNCRDQANTQARVDQLLSWLTDEAEDERLAERAGRRADIVRAMA